MHVPLIVLLWLFGCAPVSAIAESPVEVIWSDAAQHQPYFVRADAINRLDPDVRAAVDGAIANAVQGRKRFLSAAGAGASPCRQWRIGDSGTAQPGAATAVARAPVVAEGTVISVAVGWNVAVRDVTSIALVRLEDVWKGGNEAGDVVAVELPFGRMDVDNDVLCSEMRDGTTTVAVGSRLLVLGQLLPESRPPRLEGAAWPIRGIDVFPYGRPAESITALRHSAQ